MKLKALLLSLLVVPGLSWAQPPSEELAELEVRVDGLYGVVQGLAEQLQDLAIDPAATLVISKNKYFDAVVGVDYSRVAVGTQVSLDGNPILIGSRFGDGSPARLNLSFDNSDWISVQDNRIWNLYQAQTANVYRAGPSDAYYCDGMWWQFTRNGQPETKFTTDEMNAMLDLMFARSGLYEGIDPDYLSTFVSASGRCSRVDTLTIEVTNL